jgi:RNA polymerase sigma-70 factor (ECF subfamily)
MASETDRARLVAALAAVANGDRGALQQVYRDTSAKLYGVVLRILDDAAEAEDVLQDIYLTVWKRAGAFDPGRGLSPITWLVAIARNKAIDRLRATARPRAARPLDEAVDIADSAPPVSDALERSDEAAALARCLSQLDPQHADTVRTAFFEGVTYEALAVRIGAPVGTVKSWIRRSLQRLRTCLEAGAVA